MDLLLGLNGTFVVVEVSGLEPEPVVVLERMVGIVPVVVGIEPMVVEAEVEVLCPGFGLGNLVLRGGGGVAQLQSLSGSAPLRHVVLRLHLTG